MQDTYLYVNVVGFFIQHEKYQDQGKSTAEQEQRQADPSFHHWTESIALNNFTPYILWVLTAGALVGDAQTRRQILSRALFTRSPRVRFRPSGRNDAIATAVYGDPHGRRLCIEICTYY